MSEEYHINDNIQNNLLKALNSDSKTIEQLKTDLKDKGDKIVEKTVEQNRKVLIHSSKIYESMMDNFEETNTQLINLETLMEEVLNETKKVCLSGGLHKDESSQNGLSDITVKEFDKKIGELQNQNKACQDKIEAEKKYISEYQDKLKEVSEYVSKFYNERRLYLDKVSEEEVVNMTYSKGFRHPYQVKLIKMILESILLEKVQEGINKEKSSIQQDSADPKYQKELDKIVAKVTFEFYKKHCYNAWKFKNLVLACDEFVIHEYQRINGELPTLEKISLDLIKIKSDAEKIQDEQAISVFWPLSNAVLTIVYNSIATKKMVGYSEVINKSKANILKYDAEKNDNHGKIVILEEVKSKILNYQKTNSIGDQINNSQYSGAEVEEVMNKISQFNSQSNDIIESLKTMKNSQEENFYSYLKNVANSLIHQRVLKKTV